MSNLSNNLKYYRELRELDQIYVANFLNVNQATYSRYENGHREPPLDTVIKLADLFNVSIDVLVGRYIEVKRDNSYKNSTFS